MFSRSPGRVTWDELDIAAEEYENGNRHAGHALGALPTDYHRYLECRKKAEANRDLWFQGQNEEVALALRDRDQKYRGMSIRDRVLLGQTRWGKRPLSKDFADAEQMFSRWASFYLQCWESRKANAREKLPS